MLYLEEAASVLNEGLQHHWKGNTGGTSPSDKPFEPIDILNKGKTMRALPAVCVIWFCQQWEVYVSTVNNL